MTPTVPPDAGPINRDLSWLDFNERVLAQASHPRVSGNHPLLERVKFLAIFANNLDEFFMKRVGRLRHRASEGDAGAAGTLASIRERVRRLQQDQSACWTGMLVPELSRCGVELVRHEELRPEERAAADAWYLEHAFPVLTPLAVDPGHRFPFISNLSESLGVLLTHPMSLRPRFARVKVPDVLPRLLDVGELAGAPAEGPLRLLPLDALLTANLGTLFRGLDIAAVMPFRITRAAELDFDDEDAEVDDLMEAVELRLRRRRFAAPVRIEVTGAPEERVLSLLLDELELTPDDVYVRGGPLEYADLFQLVGHPRLRDRADLRDPPHVPAVPARLRPDPDGTPADIFARIREGDILLHHPYESFQRSTLAFIERAADDPDVLAVKQTIYRTGRTSPFIDALIRAASAGKQVACLVEIRARFEEEQNLRLARQLEDAGVHVAYGVVGLKTHCKCSIVVRRERDDAGRTRQRCYAHIGTGNYHPHTAQLYTDLGLLTCDPDLTADVVTLFHALTGHAVDPAYRRLLVAPRSMRARFLEMIDAEIDAAREGRPCGIRAKMNQLEDDQISRRLRDASAAGVPVTLFVRGFCCLRPGVPGQTETVRIVSVIGRFLEHSRIFHFAAGHADPLEGRWFIGSADWMHRNLSARVEAVTPVDDPEARRRLLHIFDVMDADRRDAWIMRPDGTWAPRAEVDPPASEREANGTFDNLLRTAG